MASAEGRSTAEVLRAARERISDPERWTRREYARAADGRPVRPQDAAACSWCAVGAVCAELGIDPNLGDRPSCRPVNALGLEVRAINDYGSHGAVLARFDEAIELAEVPGV